MLTLQYLPYTQVRAMNSHDRIELVLSLLRTNRIIIIDGRLSSKDEAALIRETMSRISEDFRGMEFGVLHDNKRKGLFSRVKHSLSDTLTRSSNGLTIIGPASILSEMRQYQDNVVLHFGDEYLSKHSKNLRKDRYKNNSK